MHDAFPINRAILQEWFDIEFFERVHCFTKEETLYDFDCTEAEYDEFIERGKAVEKAAESGDLPESLLPHLWLYLNSQEDCDWYGKREKECERRLGIRLGYYRKFTDQDAQGLVYSGGRTKRATPDFRLDGVAWTWANKYPEGR